MLLSERATCGSVKCTDGQSCLVEPNSKKPRCVSCSVRPKWCRVSKGDPSAKGPICSTNGRTYSNWCEMTEEGCRTGIALDTKHFGRCRSNRFSNSFNVSAADALTEPFNS